MSTPDARVLTVNGGSSSIKFAVFDTSDPPERLEHGAIERIELPGATFKVTGAHSEQRPLTSPQMSAAVTVLMEWIAQHRGADALTAAGHRIVHGGPKYTAPQRVTAALLAELHRLSPMDPEHLPEEIQLVEELARRFPDLAQVACFDTAFHHDLPRVASLLPIISVLICCGIHAAGRLLSLRRDTESAPIEATLTQCGRFVGRIDDSEHA